MKEIKIVADWDGVVIGSASSWSSARQNAASLSSAQLTAAAQDAGSLWYIWKGFLSFDTKAVPVSAKLLKVEMTLTPMFIFGIPNATYLIQNNWGAYDPMDVEGYSTPYSNALSADKDINDFSSLAVDTAKTIEIDKKWINRRGKTYYSLVLDRDYDNSAPPSNLQDANGTHGFQFYQRTESTVARRPTLTIQYEPRPSTCVGILY